MDDEFFGPVKKKIQPESSHLAKLSALLGIASIFDPSMSMDHVLGTDKPEKKCLLARCDVLTRHNGGYCCKEHKYENEKKGS